ncbi:MAG: type secretion system protein [Marmoricola sp.]|nr:type secretion system protein [Marmoricola sp.]
MQTRQAGLEGTGEVSLRDLVRETLRMRPTRIIVGEVRSAECLDLLLALNAGLPSLCAKRNTGGRAYATQTRTSVRSAHRATTDNTARCSRASCSVHSSSECAAMLRMPANAPCARSWSPC